MAQAPLHLGALPRELLDRIFSGLDTIRDLANFILTARFRARRRAILYGVLQNELGPALPDARFLFVFPYSDPADDVRYHDWIHVMAGVYLDMLQGGEEQGVQSDPGPPPFKELRELCRTLHLVNFITDTYITTQLASFGVAGGGGTPATASISRPERYRVMQAFYRRQIMSNAWASTRRPGSCWSERDTNAFSNTTREPGRSLGLFSAFQPWEMQKIDHAECFLMRLCRALVHLAAEGGGEQDREIAPSQFGILYVHLDYLVRYLRARGGLADAAVSHLQFGKPLPHDERWHIEYEFRYQLLPLTHFWDGLLIDDIFSGASQVPFGWSDALQGRYVQQYGAGFSLIPWLSLSEWEDTEKRWAFMSNIELWRLAGFALWDRERVEAMKRLSRFKALQTGWVLDRS